MMRIVLASLLVLLGAACSGNPIAPPAQPPSPPEVPQPPPLPSAPKALLIIGRGEVTPPLGIRGFTQILFDGSQSTGEGLTYLIEFGDGVSSTEPIARHRSDKPGPLDARLTVTDRYGRSDSMTETYYRYPIATGGGFWSHELQVGRRRVQRELHLAWDGATTLSGRYAGPEGHKLLTGALSDDRAIRVRTQDGAIEFVGVMDRHSSDDEHVVLRLAVRGGLVDGSVLDFFFVDSY